MKCRFSSTVISLTTIALMLILLPARVSAQCSSTSLFAAPTPIGLAASSAVEIADFNEDGVADFASSGGLAIEDYNSDGIMDVACTTTVAIRLGIASQGRATGSFTPPVDYVGGLGDSIGVLLGQGANGVGDGTFRLASRVRTPHSPQEMAKGDFNRDGITDLAVTATYNCAPDTAKFVVLTGQGTNGIGKGDFSLTAEYRTNPIQCELRGIAVADVNRDGADDVIVLTYGSIRVKPFVSWKSPRLIG